MKGKESKHTSIFDFIEENSVDIKANISNGHICFVDKYFDNILVSKIFMPLSNTFSYLKDLRYCAVGDVLRIIKKNRQEEFLRYINLVMNGIDFYQTNLEATISRLNDITILYMRASGLKLAEIGAKSGLTRERIRQMEVTVHDIVMLYVDTYIQARLYSNAMTGIIFYNFNEMFSFIKKDNIKKTIMYAIKSQKEYPYAVYDEDFCAYVNPNKLDSVQMVKNNIVLEDYFNYYDRYSKLNNSLILNQSIYDFRLNIYLEYLRKRNYYFKGNLAYKFGMCSANDIISMAIKNDYPDGIMLDKEGIDRLSNHIIQLLNYDFKIIFALSRIDEANPELIIWGKSQRIHVDNVRMEKEVIDKIIEKFVQIADTVHYLLVEEAFKALSSELADTCITDKYKLYGLMKYYLSGQYHFKKMALRKLDLKNHKLSQIVYEYIDGHDMCTKDDIISALNISKASLFSVYRDHLDIICCGQRHTLIHKLKIKKEDISYLQSITIAEVGIDFTHRDSLFANYKDKIIELKIIDSVMLYDILRYYFNDNFYFNAPYIQNLEYKKSVTLRNIVLDCFTQSGGICRIDYITTMVLQKTAAKDFSLIYSLRLFGIKVFRINKEELVMNEQVTVDDITKYMISNRLHDYFSQNSWAFEGDIENLSKGMYYGIGTVQKIPMNMYALTSYIENNLASYKVLSSVGLNNYYDANYVLSNKYETYTDFLYAFLKERAYHDMLGKKEAIRMLVEKKMLSTIPIVLITEGYLKIEDDVLIFLK